jgi:hypothetical protein
MDTWELDNPTPEQVDFLKEWVRGMGNVQRLDGRYVNVQVHQEGTDDLLRWCEDNRVECRLI